MIRSMVRTAPCFQRAINFAVIARAPPRPVDNACQAYGAALPAQCGGDKAASPWKRQGTGQSSVTIQYIELFITRPAGGAKLCAIIFFAKARNPILGGTMPLPGRRGVRASGTRGIRAHGRTPFCCKFIFVSMGNVPTRSPTASDVPRKRMPFQPGNLEHRNDFL